MKCPVCTHTHSKDCNHRWYSEEASRLRKQAEAYEAAAAKCVAKKSKEQEQ